MEPSAELDGAISLEEVAHAVRSLRTGKSAGPDDIPNELLRRGEKGAEEALLQLFQTIWRTQVWPSQWELGNIKPLYKQSGDPQDLENYRGITLLSCLAKTFETVLNQRLYNWSESHTTLHDAQGGFRPGRRSTDSIFALREAVSERRERGLATFCCFVDVRKAYDRVWRDGLWLALWNIGVCSTMFRMIRSMFVHMRRQVAVEGQTSGQFPVELGVAQGAVLSPILYAIFINSLLQQPMIDC